MVETYQLSCVFELVFILFISINFVLKITNRNSSKITQTLIFLSLLINFSLIVLLSYDVFTYKDYVLSTRIVEKSWIMGFGKTLDLDVPTHMVVFRNFLELAYKIILYYNMIMSYFIFPLLIDFGKSDFYGLIDRAKFMSRKKQRYYKILLYSLAIVFFFGYIIVKEILAWMLKMENFSKMNQKLLKVLPVFLGIVSIIDFLLDLKNLYIFPPIFVGNFTSFSVTPFSSTCF